MATMRMIPASLYALQARKRREAARLAESQAQAAPAEAEQAPAKPAPAKKR